MTEMRGFVVVVVPLELESKGPMEVADAETTRLCLQDALQGTGQDTDFITATLLQRPTFPFLRAIVALFCQHLSFAQGLYTTKELGLALVDDSTKDDANAVPTSRKEKIAFLVKILGVVSILTGERFGIYISPASVLSGQDVEATHTFLRALASRASKVSPEESREAAAQVLAIGETTLYRQGVKTRNTIVSIQAVWRGRLVRRGGEVPIQKVVNAESSTDAYTPAIALALDISDDEVSLSGEENLRAVDREEGSVQREAAVQDGCGSDYAEKTQTESETPGSLPTSSLPESTDQGASPASPTASNTTKVYVGLDGKKKVAAKDDKTSEVGTDGSSSSSVDAKNTAESTSRVPQHQQAASDPTEPRKKPSLPKRSVPTARIRNARPRAKVDAYTSVALDNDELMRDMSELYVKQLKHREAVEVFRKAEVNLKVRVHRTTEKESELKRKEAEIKEREERVTRVAENLRKQQHLLRQQQDAIKADTASSIGRGSIAANAKANEESKPPIDPSIAAEIKGLRRKLFRSERKVQKRDDIIRSLCRQFGRLKKAHQRLVEEAEKNNALKEESGRSSWLVERSTNSAKSASQNHTKVKVPPKDKKKKRVRVLPVAKKVEVPGESTQSNKGLHVGTATVDEASRKQQPRVEKVDNAPERPTRKPSVSFSPNVEVTRFPAPPSSAGTPTRRTRRVAYMQQAKAEIVPLSSEKIRQSLSEES